MSTCRGEILSAIQRLQIRNGGKPVSPIEIIREMNRVGTVYPDTTIRSHVVSAMCVNAPRHHATDWPDLRRVDRGLYVFNESASPDTPAVLGPSLAGRARSDEPRVSAGSPWPWEGAVQAVFADVLRQHGWTVTSVADTATKARGVDLLARKADRRVGAEVKGWPSSTYSDPKRAGEIKPTAPTNQAGHWFSQAVTKALMLIDSHPGTESLVVLPDFPRYRDLAVRTRTGRARAEVHVVLVHEDGSVDSETWSP